MKMIEEIDAEDICVKAPVDDPDIPVWSEVMAAAPDPADPDQAVLLNVPFLVDGLNFGDIVRLGAPDELDVRPIVEVVVASGHVRLMAATVPGEAGELIAELERMFPGYALQIEGAESRLLAISVHPDVDPVEVAVVIERWLALDAEDDEESVAISPLIDTEIGPVHWPSAGRL